jgi:hypothetical protein
MKVRKQKQDPLSITIPARQSLHPWHATNVIGQMAFFCFIEGKKDKYFVTNAMIVWHSAVA